MMTLSIFGLEHKIKFKDDCVNVLEINNKKMFTNIIKVLNDKCNGEAEENNQIILMENDNSINISKNMLMLIDIFNIEFNSKKFLNQVYSIITKNIENNQEDDDIEETMLKLRNYLIREINELPFEFNMNVGIEIIDLLKIYDVKIDTTAYITITEKIEFIINMLASLKIAKILIIPNLKLFLNEEEIIEIYKYSIYNNINLLIIENNTTDNLLKYECKNIIDDEFDEF